MTRLQADLCLLLTAIIWGTAFIAQKAPLATEAPLAFVALRFLLPGLLLLPFALRERRRNSGVKIERKHIGQLAALCVSFAAGVILQQLGLVTTTVGNAGFLTGLYVVFVPVIAALVCRDKLSGATWGAAFLALGGVWLLAGKPEWAAINSGDILVLIGALGFAVQTLLLSRIQQHLPLPLTLSVTQYLLLAVIAAIGSLIYEQVSLELVMGSLSAILYAGIMSGGIAYTLQAVAQRYTPASDAAVILSGESVVAAIAGAIILSVVMTTRMMFGCMLVMVAIMLVELGPRLFKRKQAV